MKLSFSTKGWHNASFAELCAAANDLKLDGIELHNVRGTLFTDRNSAFRDQTASATLRELYEKRLSLPAVDVIADIAGDPTAAAEELRDCLRVAAAFHIPAVRLRAAEAEDAEAAAERAAALIAAQLPEAESLKAVWNAATDQMRAGKVAAANIDEYLGFKHTIAHDVEIPEPKMRNQEPCGRVEMHERDPFERKCDFSCIEDGMTEEEMLQETSRCLRCDHYGYGVFKGGRLREW